VPSDTPPPTKSSPRLRVVGSAQRKSPLDFLTKPRVSYKEREYFTENLSLLLKAAVPIGETLASLGETSQSAHMKKTLVQMNADIESGYSLADALERSGLAGKQTLALVRLGEASGHLVENLQLAAQQEEKRHTFRAKVRSALIYPIFVMSLTTVIGLGIAWFLLPRLATTFKGLNVKLPLISRLVVDFGTFLKLHGLVVVPIVAAVVGILIYILFFAPRTKVIGQRILMIVPGIGRLMREVEIAQFGYLLGTLLDAGLSVTQALKLMATATNLYPFSSDWAKYR